MWPNSHKQAGSRRGSRRTMLCTYVPSTSLEKMQRIPAINPFKPCCAECRPRSNFDYKLKRSR